MIVVMSNRSSKGRFRFRSDVPNLPERRASARVVGRACRGAGASIRDGVLRVAMTGLLAPLLAGGTCNPPARECPPGAAVGVTTVSFAADIQPIFTAAGCLNVGCHGATFPSSGYDISTYEGVFRAGDQALQLDVCNVVPGDPGASYLIEKLESDAPRLGVRMPQLRTPLTAEQIELIRTWILEGAANN